MPIARWLRVLVGGAIAGAIGALLMVLMMLAMRRWLGISPPFEALPDRVAPTLDIPTFFSLFGRFGGYNGLKRFGIESGLAGLAVAGIVAGIVYAWVVERAHSSPKWRWGISRPGLVFVIVAATVLWIATLAILWPILFANFRGLPIGVARLVNAMGLLVAYAGYGAGLILTYRLLAPPSMAVSPSGPSRAGLSRRTVVVTMAGALLAIPSVALLRWFEKHAVFSYDGLAYSGPGVQPIVPNDKFYTVTKNVVDPNVDQSLWRLSVRGLVDRPRTYAFAELAALPAVDQESTLMCISNQIGAGLFSNAVWHGVRMRDLLQASSPREGAVEVLLLAADGYTDTFAFDKAMEPTTLVVYQMNGQPLPQRHGFPVRVIVPGLYGEKNVKWVTAIDVIDHDGKGFYEQQGWGPNFVVPTRSDFFSPKVDAPSSGFQFREPFHVKQTAQIRGRALAGDRGVRAVEVSTDDGETWRPARIDYPGTHLTWTFWSFDWRPTATGQFHLVSRATDGTGAVQPPDRRGIVPQGATGYHRVLARVEALSEGDRSGDRRGDG